MPVNLPTQSVGRKLLIDAPPKWDHSSNPSFAAFLPECRLMIEERSRAFHYPIKLFSYGIVSFFMRRNTAIAGQRSMADAVRKESLKF